MLASAYHWWTRIQGWRPVTPTNEASAHAYNSAPPTAAAVIVAAAKAVSARRDAPAMLWRFMHRTRPATAPRNRSTGAADGVGKTSRLAASADSPMLDLCNRHRLRWPERSEARPAARCVQEDDVSEAKTHECRESDTCTCYALADEPNEKCPVHGAGEWPPRCATCGKLLPWSVRKRKLQVACGKCALGVMDANNPHLTGSCTCECHAEARP